MRIVAALALVLLVACSKPAPDNDLRVACAANLSTVFPKLIARYGAGDHAAKHVVGSFGATAQLTQQIVNGAPFDVFLGADAAHATQLVNAKQAATIFTYAQGRLALYSKQAHTLADLRSPEFRTIAIANPALAPFGQASIEALHRAGLWEALQPRIVYAPNIADVKTYVDTGNADAGLTALSLAPGAAEVDQHLYTPLLQAGCVLTRTRMPAEAEQFAHFLTSPAAQAIFRAEGYATPALK